VRRALEHLYYLEQEAKPLASLAAWEIGWVMVCATTEKIPKQSVPFRGTERNTAVHAFDFGISRVIRRRVDQHDLIFRPAAGACERYRLWRAHGPALSKGADHAPAGSAIAIRH
jgi:hypothetical protein